MPMKLHFLYFTAFSSRNSCPSVIELSHSFSRLSFMPVCGRLRLKSTFFLSVLVPTWNESSQRLVLFVSIPVRLPPVRVVLADNVKDVSLLKRQPQLSTWQERVIGGIVVKVGSYVHLREDTVELRVAGVRLDRYHEQLTTVCLCGAGLIWELGIKRKVREPCICCWWTNRK